MLQSNYYFIHSIILLLVVSECVYCEKYNKGDISGRFDLKTSVNTKFNEIHTVKNGSTTVNKKMFQNGYNGSALIEEFPNLRRLSNSKHRGKTQKLGNFVQQNQNQKKKKNQKDQQNLAQKILPLMIIPFMISTALIPIMLFVIKLLFVKAVFVAKIAVTLGAISFFKRKSNNEGRKRREESLLSRLLPLLVMPFMMSTMMLPMALTQLKFMLLQAIFLGKLAIIFATFNILKNMGDKSGLYSHNVHLRPHSDHVMKHPDLIKEHYGYTGNEEYGAYINEK